MPRFLVIRGVTVTTRYGWYVDAENEDEANALSSAREDVDEEEIMDETVEHISTDEVSEIYARHGLDENGN